MRKAIFIFTSLAIHFSVTAQETKKIQKPKPVFALKCDRTDSRQLAVMFVYLDNKKGMLTIPQNNDQNAIQYSLYQTWIDEVKYQFRFDYMLNDTGKTIQIGDRSNLEINREALSIKMNLIESLYANSFAYKCEKIEDANKAHQDSIQIMLKAVKNSKESEERRRIINENEVVNQLKRNKI